MDFAPYLHKFSCFRFLIFHHRRKLLLNVFEDKTPEGCARVSLNNFPPTFSHLNSKKNQNNMRREKLTTSEGSHALKT